MKRVFSLLLALVILLGMIPAQVNAAELDNGLQYEVYEDHVQITGYTGDAEEVVIPEEIEGLPVTGIFHSAFSDCHNLTNISIPDSISFIGNWAFYNCSSLVSIAIPDGVTRIGANTFNNCSALTSIAIPDSITSIGPNAFYACTALTSITIPDSVTSIDYDAFCDCSNLTSIAIPEGVTFIGSQAFSGCTSLASVSLPESLTCISDSLFIRCSSLTDIIIPDSITSIGEQAFHSCASLTSIAIPNGVTSIGARTFSGCSSLTNITIPDSITSIGEQAFIDCTSLTSISVPVGVSSIGAWAFYGCSNLTNFTIPNNVTSINETSFAFCSSLTSISIPDNITSIENCAFSCTGLTTIHFEGDAPMIATDAFINVTATAYYPAGNTTWTADVMQNYGGNITWVAYGSTTPVNPFTDVPAGSWFEAPVLWALESGITSGTSDTTFAPGNQCLRAHVVTFLWNAEETPEPAAASSSFSDVPAGAWYEKPVLWAVENGITSGVSPTKFGAGDVCSRYQVVFFLWKAAGSPEPKTTVNPFTDVNPGHFFYKAVLWAVENGITSGTSDTTFSPTQPCNRAQVVTFLYAAYN